MSGGPDGKQRTQSDSDRELTKGTPNSRIAFLAALLKRPFLSQLTATCEAGSGNRCRGYGTHHLDHTMHINAALYDELGGIERPPIIYELCRPEKHVR